MDYAKYENSKPYPNKKDYTKYHFYKQGELKGTFSPAELEKQYGSVQAAIDQLEGVHERQFDMEGYRKALDAYRVEDARLADEFRKDALEEAGLPDDDFSAALYSKAYDDGHSGGYGEVFIHLQNLAELYTLAKRVFAGKVTA